MSQKNKYFIVCLAFGFCSPAIISCRSTPPAPTSSESATTSALTPHEFQALNKVKLPKTQAITRFAFGSCAHQKKPQPIWKAVEPLHPQFYLSLGDTVYASKKEDQPIGEAYYLQSTHADFQNIRNTTPLIGAWDDHDAGENDGGGDNPLLSEAKEHYMKNMTNDAPEIPADRKGNYHSFLLGPKNKTLQVIVLDTRSYRDDLEKNEHPKHALDIYQPTQDTKKTFLGHEQWQWLESQLRTPAQLRVLVSSVQFLAEEHGFEKWANFPHERQRLLSLLRKHKINNLIVLSGDRHSGEFDQMKTSDKHTLWEITASGINRNSNIENEPNKYRVSPFFVQSNFGDFQIDWKTKVAKISLIDETGKILHEESIRF